MQSDLDWDLKLNISTDSVDYSMEDGENYGYDPTPYAVLEEIIQLDIIKKDDVVVDYGCGKGRVSFFLNSQTGCRVIGIDHSLNLLENANENLKSYGCSEDVIFINSKAEDYCPPDANRLYFFNPFSSRILRRVLKRVEESFNKNPREILIFFYYSTIEYKMYLPTEPRLELIESVDFSDENTDNGQSPRLDIFKFRSYP